MRDLPTLIELDPGDEFERLWSGATAAFARAGDDLAALYESVDLGLRAAEILLFRRLQPARARLPAAIAARLEPPQAEIDAHRDALLASGPLGFVEALDLLSDDPLACVAPHLHAGGEDRRSSCIRSRATARETVGWVLDGDARDRLLLLAAYRNRIFRCPPPVRIAPRELLAEFPSLIQLVAGLRVKARRGASS